MSTEIFFIQGRLLRSLGALQELIPDFNEESWNTDSMREELKKVVQLSMRPAPAKESITLKITRVPKNGLYRINYRLKIGGKSHGTVH